MYLRRHARAKDGKEYTYWSLVETVRTPDGPRQRALCYLGELNGSVQAHIDDFNQFWLFPLHELFDFCPLFG
ncbi:MAG: hypothetical protein DMG21_09250 [Acidobacteria bacterium]|nr:MAG: hypothetical protein DMG21_09250 [Acidobacteriota bacterium]